MLGQASIHAEKMLNPKINFRQKEVNEKKLYFLNGETFL